MTNAEGTQDYRPLFEPGLHEVSIQELRRFCVDRFPSSESRGRLMAGLETIVFRLHDAGVQGEIWVNGSFVTDKTDPADLDLVLFAPAESYDRGTPAQRQGIRWVEANLRAELGCHSYFVAVYPEGHTLRFVTDRTREYWTRQFGSTRGRVPKGVAVVKVG